MIAIMKGRRTARTDEEFVVFIMGMRINRWWMIHCWRPVILAMTGMTHEFVQQPKRGWLGSKAWFERAVAIIQHLWPFDAPATYTKAQDRSHVPTLAGFNRKIGNDGTIGICNETYRIAPGWCGNVFANMPAFLLGNCTTLKQAKGEFATAAGQMGRLVGDRNAGLNISGRMVANDQFSSRARPLVGSHR